MSRNNEIATLQAQVATLTQGQATLTAGMEQLASALNAFMSAQAAPQARKRNSKKAQPKAEKVLVTFTKKDGTQSKPCSPAQAVVRQAYRDNGKSKEELATITFDGVWTPEMDAIIIANSTISAKDFKKECKKKGIDVSGCTKAQLHDHKVELRKDGKCK